MENNLFVSVVIPLYNAESYIQRAVTSVLNQTVQNFEIIVVDDGSTDASYQEVMAIKDLRLKVIHQENQGSSVARNTGIAHASAPLIAFLDSDDEWKPNFLEKMQPLISQYPDCVLFGAGYETLRYNGLFWLSKDMFPVDWAGILPNYFEVMSAFPFCTCTAVVKKSVLMEIGGFPVGVKFGQDLATWLRCSLVGKFAYIHQPLALVHRDVETSSTLRFDRRKEPYPIIMLRQLLREHAIPLESRTYALDYIARSSLKTSKARFRAGEPIRALVPLWNCFRSRAYRKKIFPLVRSELLHSIKKAIFGQSVTA
jgi:glycosyltransferase involved in cell wall biosynthesis